MEKNARDLLATFEGLLPGSTGQWMYGSEPTALDAHLVVFIARMTDVGRENLISERLREYARWAWAQDEWSKMMEGRKTMVPPN
jgi:glutathione S-transferase